METVQPDGNLFLIALPLFIAFGLGRIYAVVGGDEWIGKHYKIPKVILHVVHHWQAIFLSIGIGAFYFFGFQTGSPLTEILVAVFWLGIGLFLEDFTFHIAHGKWWGEDEPKK